MNVFRPWGHIDWLLSRLDSESWSLLACCSSEPRSIALAKHLGRNSFRNVEIITIHDPDPLNPEENSRKLDTHIDELQNCGFQSDEISDMELLAGLDVTRSCVEKLMTGNLTNIIIDITSLPKIWFFPIIQAVLESGQFNNVIVTYTSASGYPKQLSYNLAPLRVLPGFYAEDGRNEHESIIVGIGFEPFGLVSLLKNQQAKKIRLIFPFPPGPPGHRRNWIFVKKIEEHMKEEQTNPPNQVHIDMYDCPQIFEALCSMTSDGQQTSAIAPYGPKTISLAMCLFALAAAAAGRDRVPVFYAQPQRYALDYSIGTKMHGDIPDITGYCLQLAGRNLYTLP